jgi:cation transport regulator ChaB
MPYKTNAELPEAVQDVLPAAAQSVFRTVVNSQEERGLSTERAFASAWAALKNQGWERGQDGVWHKVAKSQVTLEIPIAKADDTHQRVFGWASVAVAKDGTPVIDLEGDEVPIAELEAAMYDYVAESGEMVFDHGEETPRGQLIEALVFTPEKLEKMGIPAGTVPLGAWVGYYLPDSADYQRAKDGGRLMFSLEGSAQREEVASA